VISAAHELVAPYDQLTNNFTGDAARRCTMYHPEDYHARRYFRTNFWKPWPIKCIFYMQALKYLHVGSYIKIAGSNSGSQE